MVFALSPVVLGAAVRFQAAYRRRERDQVKLLEREQLARELHDTVAHHVSAIAIRAQAGRVVAATDPDAAVDALAVIEAEASRALDRDAAHGAARCATGDEADLAPQPGVADLERLARGIGDAPPVDARARPATWTPYSPRSAPRSTGSPRSRSPTRYGMPGTPPASTSSVDGDGRLRAAHRRRRRRAPARPARGRAGLRARRA